MAELCSGEFNVALACSGGIHIYFYFRGVFGLWFDEDLYHGRTNKCETFDNDILTSSEDFVVKGVEAWAFIWD